MGAIQSADTALSGISHLHIETCADRTVCMTAYVPETGVADETIGLEPHEQTLESVMPLDTSEGEQIGTPPSPRTPVVGIGKAAWATDGEN